MTTQRLNSQFGNYRLLSLLRQGGFSEVYLGEHIYLKTQAAVKLLTTRLEQDELARFLSEARIIAGLDHHHIVRVLDFGFASDIATGAADSQTHAGAGTSRGRPQPCAACQTLHFPGQAYRG